MWSSYSIENKSMAFSYHVFMDESGILIPQNLTEVYSVSSGGIQYSEFQNSNVTLIERNDLIDRTMINSSALLINKASYSNYIITFDLLGSRRYFLYGSAGYNLVRNDSTHVGGIPVKWQNKGFTTAIKEYDNGTDLLVVPYVIHLSRGNAFFIDPTVGKPMRQPCRIVNYGNVYGTLSAPSSAFLGQTITLSLTVTSIHGSSPRKVKFYVCGSSANENVYTTSVSAGNTYSYNWNVNLKGNMRFYVEYFSGEEYCLPYKSSIYSCLGSVSISEPSIIIARGYDGNNKIYMNTMGSVSSSFSPPVTQLFSECNYVKLNLKHGYRANAFGFGASYMAQFFRSGLDIHFYLGGSGWVATNCTGLGSGIGGPIELFNVTLGSGMPSATTYIIPGTDRAVHMVTGSECHGDNITGVITPLMIGIFATVAGVVIPEVSVPAAVLSTIMSLISISGGQRGWTHCILGPGSVYQCFNFNGNDYVTSGSVEAANYSAGTEVSLCIPNNYISESGTYVTVAGCSEALDGSISFDRSFELTPAFVVYGYLDGSNGAPLSNTHLYLRDNSNGVVYEITTMNGKHAGYFYFYADQGINYSVMYRNGNQYDTLTSFTAGAFRNCQSLGTLKE